MDQNLSNRSVKAILYAHPFDMGGMPIRQPFPTNQVAQIDPFILLHHAIVPIPKERDPKHTGVGPHPHRGFSPVTFIFEGGVHHQDSRGNNNTIYKGGIQWMNAGMGIIHSERPPADIQEIGGKQEIIQMWINTPASHKMDEPAYIPLTAEEIPTAFFDQQRIKVCVQSGNVLGVEGPIKAHTEINSATLFFEAGAGISIPLNAKHNAFIYLLDGQVSLAGHGIVEAKHAVYFANDGEQITITANSSTRILLMSGMPINEKMVSHGPFVMNSETQLMEAFRDYQMGKMGVLIEE